MTEKWLLSFLGRSIAINGGKSNMIHGIRNDGSGYRKWEMEIRSRDGYLWLSRDDLKALWRNGVAINGPMTITMDRMPETL